MGETQKRSPQAEHSDSPQRKKHHPRDHWRHYEVSGQFNACMDDPDKDNSKPESDKEDKICIDGDLNGNAHVNSDGLIVGEAEVHNSYNDIDVNFEMHANRKHKNKGPVRPNQPSSPQGPNGPANSGDSDSDSAGGEQKSLLTPAATSAASANDSDRSKAGSNAASNAESTNLGENGSVDASTTEHSEAMGNSTEVSGGSSVTSGSEKSRSNSSDQNSKSHDAVGMSSNEADNTGNEKDDTGSPSDPKIKKESRSESASSDINLSSTQVNQAPFIQKLYAMLEDPKLDHVIRWAPSHDRFYINPSEQFSQTLCLYFKHTNISSFVRQLSMYGFHKVANAGHHRDKWYPWEFRHMDGAFRRGDIQSLRNIKRRSTRQMAGKRVKYVTLVNGNDATKQETSPGYSAAAMPGLAPNSQAPQVPQGPQGPQAPPLAPVATGPTAPPSTVNQLIPQYMPDGQTQPQPQPSLAGAMQQMMFNGQDGVSNQDQTMRLLRMHQSVQSQLMMVQETMSRLSQNMGEMGVAIDQLVSQQHINHAQHQHQHLPHATHPQQQPQQQQPQLPAHIETPNGNGNGSANGKFLAMGTDSSDSPSHLLHMNGKHSHPQPPQPQPLAAAPVATPRQPSVGHQVTQPPVQPIVPAPGQQTPVALNRDDNQNRFGLRTLLN